MTDEAWRAKRATLDEVVPGEDLCGCDGVPCRVNSEEEDGEVVCGSCGNPCHSAETA